MAKTLYSSGREILPVLNVQAVSGGSITSTKAGTYYFWVQGKNSIGYNKPSNIIGVNVAAGQRIQIIISTDHYRAGEFWNEFIVSFSSSNSSVNGCIALGIPALTTSQTVISLPTTVFISRDEQLELNKSVSNIASLPSGADLINGMVRNITNLGIIYRYDSSSTLTVDNINVLAAASGRWIKWDDGFNINVVDTENDSIGAKQEILANADILRTTYDSYPADGTQGKFQKFWIVNNSTSDILSGTAIGLNVSAGGFDKSTAFNGLLRIVPEGFVDLATGNLDTTDASGIGTMLGIGSEYIYSSAGTGIRLQKSLPPNSALSLRIYPKFTANQLANQVPNGTTLSVYPTLSNSIGEFTAIGELIGDVITNDLDRVRIVPGINNTARSLAGSGIVKSFAFTGVGESTVYDLVANAANQKVIINGNGVCFIGNNPSSTEAIRAIIGTVSGVTNPSTYTSTITGSATTSFNITVPYPYLNGNGIIRSDYPDSRIQGNNLGYFNPSIVKIYIQRTDTNEIRLFNQPVVPGLTQVFLGLSWLSGTIVGSLPTQSDPEFSLYSPQVITTWSTISSGAVTFRVCTAFEYDGSTITSISHDPGLGCIEELSLSIIDAINNFIIEYGSPVGLGNTNSNGTNTTVARSNHVHKRDVRVAKAGTDIGTRNRLNFIDGSGITVNAVDDSGSDEIDITISAAASAITVQEEGVSLATAADTLNFVGSGVTASGTTGTKTITITSGSAITVQEEGSNLTTAATTLNFVGGGITAAGATATKTITAPGLIVQEEGSSLASNTEIVNFVGAGVTASGTGTTKTVTIPGASAITVQDEGVSLATAASVLNFVGEGVTASGTGSTKIIAINGNPSNTTTSSGILTYAGVTSSLAANAQENLNIGIPRSFILARVQTNVDARIRLYSTDAARTADISRAEGDPIPDNSGIICDVTTTAAALTTILSPSISGTNLDIPQNDTIYIRVTNKSASASIVNVILNATPVAQIPGTGDLQTATITSSLLADTAGEDLNLSIQKALILANITTSVAARVRIYSNIADRTSDVARVYGAAIPDNISCILDIQTVVGDLSKDLAPFAAYINQENPQTNTLYIRVTNISGATSAVQVTCGYITLGGGTGSGGRELLTSNRTYYVRTDGSDSNTGLTNTSGGAFLTVQKAVDTAATLDLGIYDITIQIADGTYVGSVLLKSIIGSGSITIQGNLTTPANVILNRSANGVFDNFDGIIKGSSTIGIYKIRDLTVSATGTNLSGIVSFNSFIEYQNIIFGAVTDTHLFALEGGKILCTGNYSITGGATTHYYANANGNIRCQNKTITMSGTQNYTSQFALSNYFGVIAANGNTYTGGTITGQRYNVSETGIIVTVGGPNYFPGSIAGTPVPGATEAQIHTAKYGQYI